MRIGFVGAGNIGQGLTRLITAAGYEVSLSNSRGPESLSELADELGASATNVAEAVLDSDIVVLSVPFPRVFDLNPQVFGGKIVVDTCNYYPSRDGLFEPLERNVTTTSEMVQEHLAGAQIVKAFNAIMADDLVVPFGLQDERRALPIASNYSKALDAVVQLHEDIGFDWVRLDELSNSWRFERAKPSYCIPLNRQDLTQALDDAQRDVELPHNSWKRTHS